MHRLGQWDQGWKLRSNARRILTSFPSSYSWDPHPSFFYILYKFPSKDRVGGEVVPHKPSQLLRWQSLKTPGLTMNTWEEGLSPFHNLHPNFCWSLLSPRGTYNIPRLVFVFSGFGGSRNRRIRRSNLFSKTFQKIHPRGGDARRPMEWVYSHRFPKSLQNVFLSFCLGNEQIKLNLEMSSGVKRLSLLRRYDGSLLKCFVFIFSCLSTECSVRQGQLRETPK